VSVLKLTVALLRGLLASRAALTAENLALRHQLGRAAAAVSTSYAAIFAARIRS
jgi:hypothetical protein